MRINEDEVVPLVAPLIFPLVVLLTGVRWEEERAWRGRGPSGRPIPAFPAGLIVVKERPTGYIIVYGKGCEWLVVSEGERREGGD